MPSCNLGALVRSANKCTFSLAGVGDRIYIFDIDECFASGDIPEPSSGFYAKAELLSGITESDSGIAGHCYAIDIKSDSGQVTSEKSEDQEGRSLVATAVINHSIDRFLAIDEAIAFKNIGVIVPDNAGKYYVIMSKYKKTKYTSNFDSGTTYDSDHGFTITFTCAPVTCACPKVELLVSELNATTANEEESAK